MLTTIDKENAIAVDGKEHVLFYHVLRRERARSVLLNSSYSTSTAAAALLKDTCNINELGSTKIVISGIKYFALRKFLCEK